MGNTKNGANKVFGGKRERQWTETPNEASAKLVNYEDFVSAECLQVMLTCFSINVFYNKIKFGFFFMF